MSSPLRWRLSHPSVTFDVLVGNSVPAYLCVVMSSLLGSQWGDLHHVQICSLTCTHLVCICHPLSTPPPHPHPYLPDDRYAAWKAFGSRDLEKCTFDIERHSAFILPTLPSPHRGMTLCLSCYQHSSFSHLNMICFIAGIVGIVVTRWPVKPP